MADAKITVEPVRAELWPELERVLGERGDASGCWCQWFKLSGSARRETPRDAMAELLHESVRGEPAPGVLAWIGGEPVGWAAVEPYTAYPALSRSPTTKRVEGDPDDPWAVTCFVVRVEYRQRGVARALLRGAVDFAAHHGATTVEGYPVDPEVRPSLTNAERYHGTVSLFGSAGFRVVRRPSSTRAIMRLEVDARAEAHADALTTERP